MTDTLPAWLWVPLALLLWGYLAADTIARRLNSKETTMTETLPRKVGCAHVAALFGVTTRTIRMWADDGKLPHTRTLGGDRRFDLAEIERIIADNSR